MIIKKTLKSTVSIIAALLIFMLSITFYADRTNASNTSVEYIVFNAQTGEYLRSYTIDPLPENVNSRAIIGSDDRVVDWSKSGVVKILANDGDGSGFCTGFVIDNHTIATAAHCLYNSKFHKGRSINDILLFNTNGDVTMHATPIEFHLPKNYKENMDENRENSFYNDYLNDYALITVQEDLSSYACFNIGIATNNIFTCNPDVKISGFSAWDKNNTIVNTENKHVLFTAEDNLKSITNEEEGQYIFFHIVDAMEGASGAPMYIEESRCGKTYYTVIGIHTGGMQNFNNFGTRMTTDLMQFYLNNGNLNY